MLVKHSFGCGLSSARVSVLCGFSWFQQIWVGILKRDVDDLTDFFKSGGGSMDVVR